MAKKDAGFTLIELMIVTAIIIVLSAIAIPIYGQYVAKGRQQNAFLALNSARLAMEAYRLKNNGYLAAGKNVEQLPGYDTAIWTNVSPYHRYKIEITAAAATSFRITATCDPAATPTCNIDSDPDPDIWWINERGEMRPQVDGSGHSFDDAQN